MTPVLESVFGNRTAAQILLFLEAYGSGYARGIASTFDASQTEVRRQLLRLEANGVLVSRPVGSARVFEFNVRNPTVRGLKVFLSSELELMSEDELQAYYRQRQRPRRTGKQL